MTQSQDNARFVPGNEVFPLQQFRSSQERLVEVPAIKAVEEVPSMTPDQVDFDATVGGALQGAASQEVPSAQWWDLFPDGPQEDTRGMGRFFRMGFLYLK